MAQEDDDRALQLFKAALSLEEIVQHTHFKSTGSVQSALRRALNRSQRSKDDPGALRAVEVERIDSIYRAIYPAALQGDLSAIDRCMKLSEQRMRYSGELTSERTSILAQFNRTITSLEVDGDGVDAALVAAGQTIARQVDDSVRFCVGAEVTKALYLLPHLINVLNELGATPASRRALQLAAQSAAPAPQGTKSELEMFREKHLSS